MLFSLKARLALVYFYQDDLDETAALDEIYRMDVIFFSTVNIQERTPRSSSKVGKLVEIFMKNTISEKGSWVNPMVKRYTMRYNNHYAKTGFILCTKSFCLYSPHHSSANFNGLRSENI